MIGATTHEIQTNTEVRLSATVPNALILSCPKASSGLKPLRIELMRCNDNLHGICSSRDLGIEISLSAVEKEDQEVKMLILPFVDKLNNKNWQQGEATDPCKLYVGLDCAQDIHKKYWMSIVEVPRKEGARDIDVNAGDDAERRRARQIHEMNVKMAKLDMKARPYRPRRSCSHSPGCHRDHSRHTAAIAPLPVAITANVAGRAAVAPLPIVITAAVAPLPDATLHPDARILHPLHSPLLLLPPIPILTLTAMAPMIPTPKPPILHPALGSSVALHPPLVVELVIALPQIPSTLRMEKKNTRKRMLIRELKEWRWRERENHILVM